MPTPGHPLKVGQQGFHPGEVYPPTGFGKRPVYDSFVLCYLYLFPNFKMSWTLVIPKPPSRPRTSTRPRRTP